MSKLVQINHVYVGTNAVLLYCSNCTESQSVRLQFFGCRDCRGDHRALRSDQLSLDVHEAIKGHVGVQLQC